MVDPHTGELNSPSYEERWDPDVPKVIIDAYGQELWYRVNKGRERSSYQGRPGKFDIWSVGPDGINQSTPDASVKDEERDDIGSW